MTFLKCHIERHHGFIYLWSSNIAAVVNCGVIKTVPDLWTVLRLDHGSRKYRQILTLGVSVWTRLICVTVCLHSACLLLLVGCEDYSHAYQVLGGKWKKPNQDSSPSWDCEEHICACSFTGSTCVLYAEKVVGGRRDRQRRDDGRAPTGALRWQTVWVRKGGERFIWMERSLGGEEAWQEMAVEGRRGKDDAKRT